MGKTLIKYFGTGFSVLFLSMTDVGDGSKIKIGPIVLNPDNIVKPFKEAYNNKLFLLYINSLACKIK